ncbi:type II toxin-antitoxin system HicB family antitoxin [Crocosphaera sp. Alani8]|uniref:type II toxin-antitoxin system HicB family antitoxin n=1 Tax=Crocosphaera sp. Alani8 TaxID=3038952 RepID=UPI00313B9A92
MKYKEYKAVIEYDEDDRLFFGRVVNIRDIIIFDGLSVDELEQAFQTVIKQYIADCKAANKSPETPISQLS